MTRSLSSGCLLLVLAGCTCGAPAAAPTPAPVAVAPGTPAPPAAPADPITPPTTTPLPQHAATAAERAARVAALSPEERAHLRDRSTHLREGRRLAHADDHEGAFRELSAALALAPSDSTLLCEAGLQAHRLTHLEEAATLLARGILRSTRPSTKAACLYNLGRVLEDQSNFIGAREVYTESLALRPNAIVRDRLASLDAPEEEDDPVLDESLEDWADEDYGLDASALGRDEPFASLDDVCEEIENDSCRTPEGQTWTPPTPTPIVRELAVFELQSDEEMIATGYLFVRGDDGWRSLGAVTSSDTTDEYGRLEAYEDVDEVRFEDDGIVVEVGGHNDEAEGEADAYWECEREHGDDDTAMDECFDHATAGMTPDRWSTTYRFSVVDGRLRARAD
jgi:tetratricopeptide (TPR) repeat protein